MNRILLAAAVVAVAGCINQLEPGAGTGPLDRAFTAASRESEVPKDLLLAVAWVETRFQPSPPDALDHDHGRGATGLLGVVDRDDDPRLRDAALALGLDPEAARTDPIVHVRAGARALRDLALVADDALPTELSGWRDALALHGADGDPAAGDAYADAVFQTIAQGVSGPSIDGELLTLHPNAKGDLGDAVDFKTEQALVAGADSPLVDQFIAARASHVTPGRSRSVDRVIIHTTEGSYQSAISWFREPSNPFRTSAHYIIRSSDGHVTQMVKERDTAHHIGGYNPRSIGIEHEARAAQAWWFTDAMLRKSARLTREICLRHGIPMDRTHIVGHVEVPGASHWDPGPHFPWTRYMNMVRDPNNTTTPTPTGFCAGKYGTWCDGSDVVLCQNGAEASRSRCSAGCERMPDGVPDRCLAAPAGFCATHQGTWCDGDDVVTCNTSGGQVSRTDCAHGCQSMPAGVPDRCADAPSDPCQGETYSGRCDASTLVWCENEAVRRVNCGASGRVCGFQDDDVGHNCLAAPPSDPCQGETYAGRCNGNTLIWCEDETVRSAQCRTCGWQNDQVGNNCL